MIIRLQTPTGEKSCDLSKPMNLGLTLKHGPENPNCYWAEDPEFSTIETEDFVGDVGRGGSVNYKKVHFTPHGNGTHTETVGHIGRDEVGVNTALDRFHFLAELITLSPREVENGMEIALEDYMNARKSKTEAVIIRTLPNGEFKKQARYSGTNPPYLHEDVTRQMCEEGVQHLLVDLPSVDREVDGGKLTAHRNFWTFPRNPRRTATITELIYVSDEIKDGVYLLGLYMPLMELDATSSNPVLYNLF